MRLDHIAYRVKDRYKTFDFFNKAFGYKLGTSFEIQFDDDSHADCLALTPPEVRHPETRLWTYHVLQSAPYAPLKSEYHAPPEIFVSDGESGSIVGDWVEERGGTGGVHHIAYQVEDVAATMEEWKDKGYAEFYSEKPLVCEETHLTQVFSKPSELTGVIYEFIKRGKDNKGFCEVNVKGLMESTRK